MTSSPIPAVPATAGAIAVPVLAPTHAVSAARFDSKSKMESLCSYLPSSILSHLVARSTPLIPPFRQSYTTAVLFADVSGYTAMCEAMSMRGNRIAPIAAVNGPQSPPDSDSISINGSALSQAQQTPRTKANRGAGKHGAKLTVDWGTAAAGTATDTPLKRSPSFSLSSLSSLPFSLSVSHGAGGDELLAKHLNSYFEQLVRTIASHGGDVFKFAGDAILVLWPPEREDDGLVNVEEVRLRVRRAAQCGMEIKTRLQDIAMGDGITLSMKVGVGVGELSILHVGGVFDRMEYIATGSPLLQAFAAEHQAAQRDVVISPQAFALIAQFFSATVAPSGYAILHDCREPIRKQSAAGALTKMPVLEFGTDPAADTALMRAVGRYVPGAVLPYISHGEEKWASELRRITVLFVNLGLGLLSESTGSPTSTFPSSTSSPSSGNTASELLFIQSILHATQLAVYKYEGSLNKFLRDDKGSTLIAVFGLPPLAHEDDSVRGLLASLAICARLIELGLKPSVGVTTGMAFCGIVGTRGRREYSVLGDKVNLAARLMQHASLGVGGVLCDHETRYAAKDRLQFEDTGKISVKGKSKPISVYQPYPKSLAPLFSVQGKKFKASTAASAPLTTSLSQSSLAIAPPSSSSSSALRSHSQSSSHSQSYVRLFEGRSGIGLSSIRSIFDIFKTRPTTGPINATQAGPSPNSLGSTDQQSLERCHEQREQCFVFNVAAPLTANLPPALLASIERFISRDYALSHFEHYSARRHSSLLATPPIAIPIPAAAAHRAPPSPLTDSESSPPHTPASASTTHGSVPRTPGESDGMTALFSIPHTHTHTRASLSGGGARRHSTPDLSSALRAFKQPASSSNLHGLDRGVGVLVQDRKVLQAARSSGVAGSATSSPHVASSTLPSTKAATQANGVHVPRSSSFTASASLSLGDLDDLNLHSAAPLVDSRRTSISHSYTTSLNNINNNNNDKVADTNHFPALHFATASTPPAAPPTFNSAFTTSFASTQANPLGRKLQVVLPDHVSTLLINTNHLPTIRQVKEEVLLTLYRRSLLLLPAELSMAEMMDKWALTVEKDGEEVKLPDDLRVAHIQQIVKQNRDAQRLTEKRGSQSASATHNVSASLSEHQSSPSLLSTTTSSTSVLRVHLHHSPPSEHPADPLSHYTELLQAKVSQLANDGRGGTVIVEGDVGLGKSLLLQRAFSHHSEMLGPHCPTPHLCKSLANPFDSTRPLSVFRDLFLTLCDAEVLRAGVAEFVALNQSANRRKLISNKLRLKRRADHPRESLDSLLGCLNEVITGLDCEETSVTAALSREERIQISMQLIAESVTMMARSHPCILIIDEAVFLDHHSWMLALALSRHCPRGLLLVLATRPMNKSNMAAFQTSAPAEYTLLLHDRQSTVVSLQPRSDEFIYTVACQAFGTHVSELPIGLAQFIIRKAHGNPLVVKELVYALQHEKLVEVTAQGQCILSPSLPLSAAYPFLAQSLSLPIPIPLTLSSILGARLDRLPYLQRMLLKCCAVIGEEISERILIRVWEPRESHLSHASTSTSVNGVSLLSSSREEVDRELSGLLEMNVLRKGYGYEERERWELVDGDAEAAVDCGSDRVKYTFTHGFMREMVLSRMLDAQKRELEAKVNQARIEFAQQKCKYLHIQQHYLTHAHSPIPADNHRISANQTDHAVPAPSNVARSSVIANSGHTLPTSLSSESLAPRPLLQGSFVLLCHRANEPADGLQARWLVLFPELLCAWDSEAAYQYSHGCQPSVMLCLDEALLCDDQLRPHALTLIPLVSFDRGELTATPHEFTACLGSDAEYERWALAIYRQLATESPMPDKLYKVIVDKSEREDIDGSDEPDSTGTVPFSAATNGTDLAAVTPRSNAGSHSSLAPSSSFSSLFGLLAPNSLSTVGMRSGPLLIGGVSVSREEYAASERRLLSLAAALPASSQFVLPPSLLYVRKHRRGLFSSSSWKRRFVYLTEDALGICDDTPDRAKRPAQVLALTMGKPLVTSSGYDVSKKLFLLTVEADAWVKHSTPAFTRRVLVLALSAAEDARHWCDQISATIARRRRAPTSATFATPQPPPIQTRVSPSVALTSTSAPSPTFHHRSSTWTPVARPLAFNGQQAALCPLPLHPPTAASPKQTNGSASTDRKKSRGGIAMSSSPSPSEDAGGGLESVSLSHAAPSPSPSPPLRVDIEDREEKIEDAVQLPAFALSGHERAEELRARIAAELAAPAVRAAVDVGAIMRDVDALCGLATARTDHGLDHASNTDLVRAAWVALAPTPSLVSFPLPLPSGSLGDFRSWSFDVFAVPAPLLFPLLRAIFDECSVIGYFSIDADTFARFVGAVAREYRPNPFHSFYHAVDVCQTCMVMIRSFGAHAALQLEPLDQLSLLVAALCHDIAHPALNNAYQIATRAPLALIYNDQSVLESHHAAVTFHLLQQPALNIFATLSTDQFTRARQTIVTGILHTDMAKHFALLDALQTARSAAALRLDWFCVLLHACDISNPCKPWHLHERWTLGLKQEIRAQRELERQHGFATLTAEPTIESTRHFNATFVLPLYQLLAQQLPLVTRALHYLEDNQRRWQERARHEAAKQHALATSSMSAPFS